MNNMGPMRTLTVAIDWILFILLAISIIFLIYGLVKKNKKMIKYAGIVAVVILVLLFIAVRIALNVKPNQ